MFNFITDKEHNIELLFSKFKDWKQVVIMCLHKIDIWTLLFIVPGIIKAYAYSLVSYIISDNPDINSKDDIKLSEEMMKGNKRKLFILELSFVGWHLLAILTLGILEIWLIAYEQTTTTKFLYDIKNNYEKENARISAS